MSICYNITASVISELGSEIHFPRACSSTESSEIGPAYRGAVLLDSKQTAANADHEGGKRWQYSAKFKFYARKGNAEEAALSISFAVASIFCT